MNLHLERNKKERKSTINLSHKNLFKDQVSGNQQLNKEINQLILMILNLLLKLKKKCLKNKILLLNKKSKKKRKN